MIENNKARWVIIAVSVITALIYFYPNVATVPKDSALAKNKITYGLDIQGGLHLVMGVDVKGVIEEKTARLSTSLKEDMIEQAVDVDSIQVAPDNKTKLLVSIKGQNAEAQLRKFIEDFYPATLQILGVDGNQAEIRYYDAKIEEFRKQVVEQAIEVIRNRVDEFGVAEPSIAAQGESRILVQLPGLEDDKANQAKELINRAARMSFRPIYKGGDYKNLDLAQRQAKVQQLIDEVEKEKNYGLGKEGLKYAAYVKQLNEDLQGKIPDNTKVVFEKHPSAKDLASGRVPFLVSTDNNLGGSELEDAGVRPDEFGKPQVTMRFNVDGRRKFSTMSEENVGNYVAIVLDDVVKSAPVINEKISGGEAVISLGQTANYQETIDEAQFIATALRAGALPAALEQLEERTVGPTLGADSIAKGKKAGIIGGILVLLFMLIYYRVLGVVANLALAFNVLLILAALASLGATLTLPGVAGIVLTVGMAVDANVIIFERIKEELRKGSGLKSAIKDGFGHALSAIVDANITTGAVCVVLMYYGTGPVRGFAVTLLIGVVTSMFTAIFFSRSLIDLLVNRFGIKKLA